MVARTLHTLVYPTILDDLPESDGPPRTIPTHAVKEPDFSQKRAEVHNLNPLTSAPEGWSIINSVKQAYDRHYRDGISPETIRIASIQNHTNSLMKICEGKLHREGDGRLRKLPTPSRHVLHETCLQSLLDADFVWHEIFKTSNSVEEVRQRMADELQVHGNPKIDAWAIGLILGGFARTFGPEAPVDWIARSVFHDFARMKDRTDNFLILNYAHGNRGCVYSGDYEDVVDKVDRDLFDWWMAKEDL